MPILARLREAGFAVWPFDQPSLPFVVEIWPRAFTGQVVKKRQQARREYLLAEYPELPDNLRAAAEDSDDAFDALVSGLAMDRHREALERLAPAADRIARLEGAIWRP